MYYRIIRPEPFFLSTFDENRFKVSQPMDMEREKEFGLMREAMVYDQIAGRGIRDDRVLQAMLKVPRHRFVPGQEREFSYSDTPLSIGSSQTISQPYIVALMTETLHLTGDERILEIGTGSGYQTAILSLLAKEVFSIEIVESLHLRASRIVKELGFKNIHLKSGDGYRGWPDQAPFDAIMLTAAPREIPPPLLEQLKDPGILIAPRGSVIQELVRVDRREGRITEQVIEFVQFVPMTGEAARRD